MVADVMTRNSEPPDAVVRYSGHDDGLVDVHLPPGATQPRPLVFYVHGGFWRQEWDRRHARPLANALASAGYVVAVPEYRRVDGAGGWPTTADDVDDALRVDGAGGWPTTADDVDDALAATPGILGEIGIPTTTITLVGHSAGGHLVLWLANQPRLPATVRRVVALAPVGNLRKAAEHGLGTGAAVDLLGGTPEQVPELYDAADPAVRMRTRPPCPVLVLHGDEDQDVPVQSSRGLKGRFEWLDYRELAGVDHFAVIDPLSSAWVSVVDAIDG